MRKLLGMGLLLAFVPYAVLASTERSQKEEGERTFACWYYTPDAAQLWKLRRIDVEAHDAREALAMCFDTVRKEKIRQNRQIVRT